MKNITLLATGGTIACTSTENGLQPTLSGEDLLAAVRDTLHCRTSAKDVFLLDSSNIQPEEWSALAQATDEALKTSDGVVIAHGTDTMAYTAAALSYMLCGVQKPVILTGSQLPIGHPLTDARQNLRRAILAATQGVPGVYVLFDERIISGVRAVKTHTTRMDAFASVNAPQAGQIDCEGIHFTCPMPPALQPYRLRAALDARVLLLKLTPGLSPDVLRFVGQAGYRGLVIEAFGLGGLHYIRRNLVESLRALAQSGVRVLVVSQCLYEKADLTVYEVGRGLSGGTILSGRDMTTEAAVTKLMWALGQENTDELLESCLCGEYSTRGE